MTGTGTAVGKTTVASGLAWAIRNRKIDVGVMKPFASSRKVHSARHRSRDVAILANAAGVTDSDKQLNPFFYSVCASPFMAGEITGNKVSISEAMNLYAKLAKKHEFLIVEGIGGIMVPLTEKECVADFAKAIQLPIVIISLPNLGTINATLLTINAIKDFGLELKGIIINKMPKRPNAIERGTPEAIRKWSGIHILGTIRLSTCTNYKTIGHQIEKNINLDEVLDL